MVAAVTLVLRDQHSSLRRWLAHALDLEALRTTLTVSLKDTIRPRLAGPTRYPWSRVGTAVSLGARALLTPEPPKSVVTAAQVTIDMLLPHLDMSEQERRVWSKRFKDDVETGTDAAQRGDAPTAGRLWEPSEMVFRSLHVPPDGRPMSGEVEIEDVTTLVHGVAPILAQLTSGLLAVPDPTYTLDLGGGDMIIADPDIVVDLPSGLAQVEIKTTIHPPTPEAIAQIVVLGALAALDAAPRQFAMYLLLPRQRQLLPVMLPGGVDFLEIGKALSSAAQFWRLD